MTIVKKGVKFKVVQLKFLWWNVNSKKFNNDIQLNLCCLLHISVAIGTNSDEFSSLIFFAVNIPSQKFLSRHLEFHIFIHNCLLEGLTLQLFCKVYQPSQLLLCLHCFSSASKQFLHFTVSNVCKLFSELN